MLRVVWSERAVDDLAEAWASADSSQRQALTRASHIVDQILRDDPFGSSESREGDARVMFEAPLGLSFKVDQDTGRVLVGHVWYYAPPSQAVVTNSTDVDHSAFFITNINCFSFVLNPLGISPVGRA